MTYIEFCKQYEYFFNSMMKYSPDEVGSTLFAEKLDELSDRYPDFEDKLLGDDS